MKPFHFLTAIAVASVMGSAVAAPEIGKPAPDFTLKDCEGNEVTLSDLKGKTVVLEWINHGCPFVVKHYSSGNMQKLQQEAADKEVVWYSVCSSAPGTQGHMSAEDATKKCEEVGSKAAGYLLDEDGKVGKLYGAKRTPEMYIINDEGILVYAGAIDSDSSTDASKIPGATNYVQVALGEVLEGKAVSTPQTQAYGCTVKYAD